MEQIDTLVIDQANGGRRTLNLVLGDVANLASTSTVVAKVVPGDYMLTVASILGSVANAPAGEAQVVALPIGAAGFEDPVALLRPAFFAGAFAASLRASALEVVNIVIPTTDRDIVAPTFASLKWSYENVKTLDISQERYAKFAKAAEEQVAGMNGLPSGVTARQAFGLALYTTNFYVELNSTLRDLDPTDPAYIELLPVFEVIDSGLANLADDPGTTYRGQSTMPDVQQAQWQIDKTVTSLSYLSTSRVRSEFYYEKKPFRFDLTGRTAKDTASFSLYPEEEESLYPRCAEHLVLSRADDTAAQKTTFTARQVLKNTQEDA